MDENSTSAMTSPHTLTPMGEANADCHCHGNQVVYDTTCHACHRHLPIDSATTFFFKKAASMVWRLVKEIDWDESARALAELHAIVSSTISLHFYSLVQALHVISDFGVDCSCYDSCARDGNEASPRKVSRLSHSLSDSGPTMGMQVPNSHEFHRSGLPSNDSNRLAIADCSNVVEGRSSSSILLLPQLSTATTQQDDESLEGNSLICSSCHEDEEDVDEFLLRNSDIIEDYIENTGNSNAIGGVLIMGDLPQFSWMIVPTDPNDDLTRQSSRNSIDSVGYIPESLSMCTSRDSIVEGSKRTPKPFDDGVMCQVPSQDDDDGGDDQLRESLQQNHDIELNMPPTRMEEESAEIDLQATHSPHSQSPTFKRFGKIISSLRH